MHKGFPPVHPLRTFHVFILCIIMLPPAVCVPARLINSSKQANVSSFHEQGTAVYYSTKFQGRKTASGERFDIHKFTAAHRTLPFGTMVRVTNLGNKKSVVVRINDRGPFGRGGHIIDLSPAAAQAIGLGRKGVARVRLVIEK